MRMGEVFEHEVTRNIPPVVFFHDQEAQRLADEVSEYIITGGYPERDPRHNAQGIHEQYVKLLTAVTRELSRAGGPELPASWISGFYGSGKSSFAKLLGLALDGRTLPDGRSLSEALLSRDVSNQKAELRKAWEGLVNKVKPIAVVFDIGGEAKDGEHIHSAVRRKVQERLGYAKHPLVADAELRLENDGQWAHFLEASEHTLKASWSTFRQHDRVDEHFSHLMHVLEPAKYPDPMSWWSARAGTSTSEGLEVIETVKNIASMLERHAPGTTLFLVVDEVSQYVHQNDDRMLMLQSFVSALGSRLKGRVWLLATGQQKLDDAGSNTVLSKLKDRFPLSLRVHLAPGNIRDVVHKRLLRKKPSMEPSLRALFAEHKSNLRQYGYKCGELGEEEFLETYPMLPGQVDLLMELSSTLRSSARSQGDAYAIRGLMQLLGELFRERKLADEPLGRLLTLDDIYDLQATAFDADEQLTMTRLLAQPDVQTDAWARRALKAIKLLELNAEKEPVRDELVAACLYTKLGDASPLTPLKPALEKLRELGAVSFSEKEGYKIQSSAGQDWQGERDALSGDGIDERNRIVRDKVAELLKNPERPRLQGVPFAWSALFSDGRGILEHRLPGGSDEVNVTVDFRLHVTGRTEAQWAALSAEQQLANRLVWVADQLEPKALQDLAKARLMVARYAPRRHSISNAKKRLLQDEEARLEQLEEQVTRQVAAHFMAGTIYFRGRQELAVDAGATFNTALTEAANARLPKLYPHHTAVAVTEKELEQLLAPTLSGVSPKFLDGPQGLGLLTQDGTRYSPTHHGPVPKLVENYIDKNDGTAGSVLLLDFTRPPYGLPNDVLRACVATLLRAHKVRLTLEDGTRLASVADPGAREVFTSPTRFKRATIARNQDQALNARDLAGMGQFFKARLGVEVEREQEALADAVFKHFQPLRDRLRAVEGRLGQLPGRPQLEETLEKLAKALEASRAHRDVEGTVKALKANLQALTEGVPLLASTESDLTEETVSAVRAAAAVRDAQLAQLEAEGSAGSVAAAAEQLRTQLSHLRPWRDIASVAEAQQRVVDHYQARRAELLSQQESAAERVRDGLKRRPGFERLANDEVHRVLRPVSAALTTTSVDAVAPPLSELRLVFDERLRRGAEEANAVLDELLSAKDERPVTRIDLHLRGREVTTRAELDTLVEEVRSRVGEALDRGQKVRLS